MDIGNYVNVFNFSLAICGSGFQPRIHYFCLPCFSRLEAALTIKTNTETLKNCL